MSRACSGSPRARRTRPIRRARPRLHLSGLKPTCISLRTNPSRAPLCLKRASHSRRGRPAFDERGLSFFLNRCQGRLKEEEKKKEKLKRQSRDAARAQLESAKQPLVTPEGRSLVPTDTIQDCGKDSVRCPGHHAVFHLGLPATLLQRPVYPQLAVRRCRSPKKRILFRVLGGSF